MPTAFVVRERVPSFRFEFLVCGLAGPGRTRVDQQHPGPELRPGEAGLSAGRPHTGGDATGATARGPPQGPTRSPVEECAGSARARSPRSGVAQPPGESPAFGRVKKRRDV